MSKTKFTPGPWYQWQNTIQSSMGTMVASVTNVNNSANDNSHLIAAAPELYEALVKCLEGVKELNGEYQEGWDSVISQAEAALLKAEGGAE